METRSDLPAGPTLVPGSRRGKPGRPKKGDLGIFQRPDAGQNMGITVSKPHASRGEFERAAVKQTVDPLVPRLLDLNGAARYLAVSPWTIRGLEAQGVLPRVRILLAGDGELRKLLFDRVDLDRLIETSKDNTTALQNGTRTSCHRRSCAS